MKHVLTEHIPQTRESRVPAFTRSWGLCLAVEGQEDFGRGAEEFWEADTGTQPHAAGLGEGQKGAANSS